MYDIYTVIINNIFTRNSLVITKIKYKKQCINFNLQIDFRKNLLILYSNYRKIILTDKTSHSFYSLKLLIFKPKINLI